MAETEKFIRAFGALPEEVDVRDYKLKRVATAVKEAFPETFELKMCAVKNQGAVGSCVAHAVAETIEYHNKVQDNITDKVSVGFIYGNRRGSLNKFSGMFVREALHNTCKYGDVFEADFKENKEVPDIIKLFEERFDSLKEKALSNRFSTYFRISSDDDIKYALINYGPVVFAMTWYDDTKVEDGVMQVNTKSKKSGGHCMVIYGWNEKGWLIQNSWGNWWGKSGRAILPYDVKKSEAWGITDEVSGENPDIKKPIFNTTFFRWLAKVINWIANLFRKDK